jgi:PEP-CTERM motif
MHRPHVGSLTPGRKLLIFALAALLFVVYRQPALADTLYTYSGSDFTTASDPFTISNDLVVSFTISGDPIICLTLCSVSPLTITMSTNGPVAFSGNIPFFSSLQIQTDSAGAIIAWNIFGLDPDDNSLQTANLPGFKVGDSGVIGDGFAFTATPGTWTITTVPEPNTLMSFGSGLLALAGALRRKKQSSA